MEFIQSLKANAQQIIELSGRLGDRVRTWDQEKSAPDNGFTDRAGYVHYEQIELFADVYAPEDAANGLIRARLAWVHKADGEQELFTMITLDFDAELEKTKALIADSDNLTQEKLVSLLHEPSTMPKYIQVSLDSGKKSDSDAAGKRYEFNDEAIQKITEADQAEFLDTVSEAYDQIVSKI